MFENGIPNQLDDAKQLNLKNLVEGTFRTLHLRTSIAKI